MLGVAFAHELAHLTSARIGGVRVIGVQARRDTASVLLAPHQTKGLRGVLVAGPVAGAVVSSLAACALLITFPIGVPLDNVRLSLAFVALLLVSLQLVTLTPLFADGKALRAASRAAKENRRAHP